MGCSSSSAQTVDQEKRPGTKPEDGSGDTVDVKNVIIAEEAQTIEDQMQLPVQTALKDDLRLVSEEEAEEVLMAMEAQEDLGSGEDLLTLPEPAACQELEPEPLASSPVEGSAEPATCQELEPEPLASSVEGSAEPEAAAAGGEVSPPKEEEEGVETEQGEAPAGLEVLVEKEEPSQPKCVEENVAEELLVEPAGAPVVLEEARPEAAETPAEAPSEAVTAEEQAPETSAPDIALTPNGASEPTEAAALAEPSAPAGAAGIIIDSTIAVATVPDIPPLSAAMTQDEPQPPTEEAGEASPAFNQPVPPADTPCPPEATTAPPVKAESAAEPVPAPSPAVAEDAPLVTSEGADAAVVESIPEPSAEVASVNEGSQESEAAIKVD
nr:uncharacterized protein LOC107395493 [Nothobranchius furzeri]